MAPASILVDTALGTDTALVQKTDQLFRNHKTFFLNSVNSPLCKHRRHLSVVTLMSVSADCLEWNVLNSQN